MKKILVIDESPLVRKYLQEKLAEYGFEVILGVNGLDGSVKLRSDLPDLVIMDLTLSRKTSLELLQEKADNPNAAEIPVIMCSSVVDKAMLMEAAKYKVKKLTGYMSARRTWIYVQSVMKFVLILKHFYSEV